MDEDGGPIPENDEPIPENDLYVRMRSSVYGVSAAMQEDAESTALSSVMSRENPVCYVYNNIIGRKFK